MMLNSLPLSPSCLFIGIWGEEVAQQLAQASCLLPPKVTCSPRWAGYFISKSSSRPTGWKMSQKWPFCPSFEHFTHFLLKRHKTLRIARQLVLSSSIRPTRIQMLVNDRPRTKLGYDKAIKGFGDYPFTDMTKLCLVPDVVISPKFKVPDFDK